MTATTGTKPLPKVGEELPNGRTLVAIRLLGVKQRDWAGDLYSVLALTGNSRDSYAVWTFIHSIDDREESRCYGGFYTGDFDNAYAVWSDRKAP